MLYGTVMTPKVAEYWSKRTANVAAMDFGDHAMGNALANYVAGPDLAIDVESGGLLNSKKMAFRYYDDSGASTSCFDKNAPLVATDDQEALMLATPLATAHNSWYSFGVALKGTRAFGLNMFILAGFGRGSSAAQYRSWRYAVNGWSGSGNYGSTNVYTLGNPFWVRLRIRATREHSRKIWAFGAAEPGSFETFTFGSGDWPTVAGAFGFAITDGPGAPPVEHHVHYLSVGYNGAAAPFPWEIPA